MERANGSVKNGHWTTNHSERRGGILAQRRRTSAKLLLKLLPLVVLFLLHLLRDSVHHAVEKQLKEGRWIP